MKFSLITVFSDFKNNIRGNASAVVLLENQLDYKQMQAIASDFNQPATTFLWKAIGEQAYHIRWFAPDAEIGLCGHGTMAATAFLAKEKINQHFVFNYEMGIICGKTDSKKICSIELAEIPVIKEVEVPEVIKMGLGIKIKGFYQTSDKYIILAENEEAVKNLKPDFSMLAKSDIFGYAVTAKGDLVDFVSRTLVPHVQQLEDHATGSSHAALVPFWADRLHKNMLSSLQLSKRGGRFFCRLNDGIVQLSGDYEIIGEGVLCLNP
ncbi:MAG: PhzF family phenazine biosynthesis protein [Bacteroidetes bacterium]|nr:PhzF family phenazine biosynthesis protein [Bacteroidota bacterium]